MPSDFVLSVADIEPAADVVAALMVTFRVVVPVTEMGAVPVTAETIVGLFSICASPETVFQSAFTFTSAPAAIPANFVFSESVNALVSALDSYNVFISYGGVHLCPPRFRPIWFYPPPSLRPHSW